MVSEISAVGYQPTLAVHDLVVEFAGSHGWVEAVSGVSFTLERGRILGLVGESGCGKTTTAMAIMGLLPRRGARVTSGKVILGDEDLFGLSQGEQRRKRGAQISMIFQEPMSSLNPAFTVGEQIAESARFHLGLSRKQAWARAVEFMNLVEIPRAAERANDYPHTFSGGQLQRCMIAMALVCDPAVVLADEPTTALDVTIQAQVLQLMLRLQHELGLAIVFITHDIGVVSEICDEVAVMYAGHIIEQSETARFMDGPAHPYSRALLECMPGLSAPGKPLKVIAGTVPRADQLPRGCRFHPRCEYAVAACTESLPNLTTLAGQRRVRCIRSSNLDFIAGGAHGAP